MTPTLRPVQSPQAMAAMPLPHNIEIEQAMLGILLVDNSKYWKILELVDADDFYDPLHVRLYSSIADTCTAGRRADPLTLRAEFENAPELKSLGGAKYLGDLAASIITTLGAEDYALRIHELATRRRLIASAHEIIAQAHDQTSPPASADALVADSEAVLFRMVDKSGKRGALTMPQAFQNTMEKVEAALKHGAPVGLSTGLRGLDNRIAGLEPGNLYVIAARPAMGKTAMGLTVATNVAMSGVPVLLHSLEMSHDQIVARIIARITAKQSPEGRPLPADRQRNFQGLTDEQAMAQFARIEGTRKEICGMPLHIDDDRGIDITQIRARAIKQKRRYGMGLLVIDYLGLIRKNPKLQNTNYQIEEITQGLKALAGEIRIPVILLAQLNREVDKRDNKRPLLADLRDSGSIEQDADAVMFLYRHEYYKSREEPIQRENETDERFQTRMARHQQELEQSRGRAELIVAKLRQGQTGTENLRFEGWKCLFTEDQFTPAAAQS